MIFTFRVLLRSATPQLILNRCTASIAGFAIVAAAVACGSSDSLPPTVESPVSSAGDPGSSVSPTDPAASTATPAADAPTVVTRDGLPYGIAGPAPPPPVDIFEGIVSPEKIVFDTFDGGSLPLPDAPQATIERLFNAIRPVYVPVYEQSSRADWLAPRDFVLGYEGDTSAYAYPVKFLNFHEIVNDEIDGIPVLITYCPLCASGVVFNRRIDGKTHVFGNTSALYQNDLVMIDHDTGSYWFQTGGEAVIGPLTGTRLEPLPSVMMPWSDWLVLNPDTLVLSRNQGFGTSTARYSNDPFETYPRSVDAGRFPFPVDEELIGEELRLSEIVLSVQVDGNEKAYPIGRTGNDAVNDDLAGTPVVVFAQDNGPSAAAYSPVLNGNRLMFTGTERGLYVDSETRTVWDFAGRAISGQLAGERLTPLPSRRAMWFSISIAKPDIEVYFPGPPSVD